MTEDTICLVVFLWAVIGGFCTLMTTIHITDTLGSKHKYVSDSAQYTLGVILFVFAPFVVSFWIGAGAVWCLKTLYEGTSELLALIPIKPKSVKVIEQYGRTWVPVMWQKQITNAAKDEFDTEAEKEVNDLLKPAEEQNV